MEERFFFFNELGKEHGGLEVSCGDLLEVIRDKLGPQEKI